LEKYRAIIKGKKKERRGRESKKLRRPLFQSPREHLSANGNQAKFVHLNGAEVKKAEMSRRQNWWHEESPEGDRVNGRFSGLFFLLAAVI
jgi:hypothetical protein